FEVAHARVADCERHADSHAVEQGSVRELLTRDTAATRAVAQRQAARGRDGGSVPRGAGTRKEDVRGGEALRTSRRFRGRDVRGAWLLSSGDRLHHVL